MDTFDILIIFSIVFLSIIVITVVYKFLWFDTHKEKPSSYQEEKENVFNLIYTIKKNIMELLPPDQTIPENYTIVFNDIANLYSDNCNKLEEDNELKELKLLNKKILKKLIFIKKLTLSSKEFNSFVFDKQIEELKTNLS